MFENPDAKRVRRSDIYNHSPSSSSSTSQSRSPSPARNSPDPEIENILLARLAEIYEPIVKPIASNVSKTTLPVSQPVSSEQTQDNGPHEIEFRLFSTPETDVNNTTLTQPRIQKIILETEIDDREVEGALVRKKPRSYYFSAPFPVGEKSVAVTGEEILEWSRKRHWGLEVGWRVTVLRNDAKIKPISTAISISKDVRGVKEGRKTKLNKKGRIKLRRKLQDMKTREENERRVREMKDETEKEKRVRRNREKKLKRRAKEKVEREVKRASSGGDVIGMGGEDLDEMGSIGD